MRLPALLAAVLASALAFPAPVPDSPGRWGRDYLRDWYARHPGDATLDGLHTHDHHLARFSPAALAGERRALDRFQRRLDAIRPADREAALELRLCRENVLERRLELDELRAWERDPQVYANEVTNGLLWLAEYPTDRPRTRLAAVMARERELPRLLREARANLRNPPPVFVKVGEQAFQGLLPLLEHDLPAAFQGLGGDAFRRTTASAAAAVRSFLAWLRTDLEPRAQGAFALGPELFARHLRWAEGVDTPVQDLLDLAERELAVQEARFREQAGRVAPGEGPGAAWARIQADHPAAGALVAEAASQLETLEAFVRARQLMTIPPHEPLVTAPTPGALQGLFAAQYMVGPFEPVALPARYYLTLPGPDFTPAEQEEHLREFTRPILWNTSIHEAIPGHFLQGLHTRRLKDPLRTSSRFMNNTFVEGWAHYCEQLMVEAGFRPDDPAYPFAQTKDALLRLCRMVVGIRMHTRGMDLEEATRFFQAHGFMGEGPARTEAERGAYDPLYLYYTFGKLELLRLREDCRRKEGEAFSLLRFHDRILASGQVPLWFHRAVLLGEAP